MKTLLIKLILCLLLVSGALAAPGNNTLKVAWDANTETNLAAYRLYEKGVNDNNQVTWTLVGTVAAGSSTTYTFSTYAATQPRTFVVTAVNVSGMESGPSNELVVEKAPNNPQNLRVIIELNVTVQ